MRVVVAPDSFKGTLTAAEAAAALADGWRDARPDDEVVRLPMADGGEGTLDALEAASPGTRRLPVRVPGPDGAPVDTAVLLLADGTALVELAATSGLTLLPAPAPRTAHTRGLGVAIRAALEAGATGLLLAIGGSASTDGGTGALQQLGARFLDATGRPVGSGGGGLSGLATVDLSPLPPLPPGGVRVLTDVRAPLLGPAGAAAVYGPQKGAGPADVAALEAGLARLAALLPIDPATTGAGAAGGTGFGLLAWGAQLVPGAAAVAEAVGLPVALAGADLAVTGEGRFDAQSADGKVVSHVVALAAAAHVPVALAAGAIAASTSGFASAVSLTALVGGEAALRDPGAALRRAGAALASAWVDPPVPSR